MGLFDCADPSHLLKNCPKEVVLLKESKNRLEYLEKKTGRKRNDHIVLFALYHQLSEDVDTDNRSDGSVREMEEVTDKELFSTLMAEFEEKESEEKVLDDKEALLVTIDLELYILSESHPRFLGACLETGTTVSPIGYEQAEAYRHFYDPKPDKIFTLMKKADDPQVNPEAMKQLENINETCDICPGLASQPGRFKVFLPKDDIVFDRTILIDLMRLSS